jgi:hypothetical protein
MPQIRRNAKVLTRQIGLVGKQTLWAGVSNRLCKMRISGGISLCVCTADFHYLCPRIKFIFIYVCSSSLLRRFAAAGSWPVKGGSAPYLANRFICHIDVCLQCNLVYRARVHIYMVLWESCRGRERKRDREEHFAADHTALEIALKSGWILYARCREAVKCISVY